MPTGSIHVLTSSSDDSFQSSSESEAEQPTTYHTGFLNGKTTPAIRKDGLAVCELCGNRGVKHAFYSKSKRFCSLACSRTAASSSTTSTTTSVTTPHYQVKTTQKRPIMVTASIKIKSPAGNYVKKPKLAISVSFNWKQYFHNCNMIFAPVSCFKHVTLADSWEQITIGMKIEVENSDCDNFSKVFPNYYWIASVVKIAGYFVQVRYEGFELDNSKDFWLNLLIDTAHAVGWCASQGKPLIPPKTIEHKHHDWKEFLVKRLTGARTLPHSFHLKIKENSISKFKSMMKLEVVDKNRISAIRVARVVEIVGGRLHVAYEGGTEGDDFWCHERSPLIHPVGWAQIVGHDLHASPDYARHSLQKSLLKNFDENEASWEMFKSPTIYPCDLKFVEGMKLEAIDPLNLSTICVATVTRVLRNNYLMIGIDGMMAANGSDWFCYHSSSPCIFPVGFCELNSIAITPPRGHKGEFKWFEYLIQTKSVAAPVSLFNKEIPNHGFQEGMYLEAVDLMEPRLVCVGQITKVVGRLLRVHFEGWEDNYDQWCDCESPDLFPVGWCQGQNYRLEAPRECVMKKKKKPPGYKGMRRKKRSKMLLMSQKKCSIKVENGVMHATDSVVISQTNPVKFSTNGLNLATRAHPQEWGVLDVIQFLRINECGAYCQQFSQQKIDGSNFFTLTKDDVLKLTGMKVGPSLKIYDLIQQLQQKK